MKTITLQGTEAQLKGLKPYKTIKEVETRVYVVDREENEYEVDINDEDFMTLAEQGGRVYTLPNFQEAFNYGDVNTFTDVIRFISVFLRQNDNGQTRFRKQNL